MNEREAACSGMYKVGAYVMSCWPTPAGAFGNFAHLLDNII